MSGVCVERAGKVDDVDEREIGERDDGDGPGDQFEAGRGRCPG